MGQSSGGGGATPLSLLPKPQQQVASKFTGSKITQNAIEAMPTDYNTKARMAGQALGYAGGGDESDRTPESASYANKSMKTGYYSQIGQQQHTA